MPSTTSKSGSSSSKSSSGKSMASKSATSKSSSSSASSKSAYRPGQEAKSDITLFVKDSRGKTISEIVVPAGHRVPPTRSKQAESYSTKK